MIHERHEHNAERWLAEYAGGGAEEVEKATAATRAWFATLGGRAAFVKWYPSGLRKTWARVEIGIAGAGLHPALVPLRRVVECADGALLVYDRVRGENLGPSPARSRFLGLPLAERADAVVAVAGALGAVCDAGYMVVDWYFGNTIYDFDARRVWLFDWELCREGGGFTLEMDSNYGSSGLMAPEEFVRGSWLDAVTLVFNVGRFALLVLPELAEPLAPVLARATYPARAGRYNTVPELTAALTAALRQALPGWRP
jgi:hypothetical protein